MGFNEQMADFNQKVNDLANFVVGKLKDFPNLTIGEQISYPAVGIGFILILVSVVMIALA